MATSPLDFIQKGAANIVRGGKKVVAVKKQAEQKLQTFGRTQVAPVLKNNTRLGKIATAPAQSNLGIARNTVTGIPKAAKEVFFPTRGYTEKELAQAKPTPSQTLQGVPKVAAEFAGFLGELPNFIPAYSEQARKLTDTKVGAKLADAGAAIVKYGKPKNVEEAAAMRFGDVLSFFPIGSTKAVKGATEAAFLASKPIREVGKFELGTFAQNSATRKADKADRFPEEELDETVSYIQETYRASDDPNTYRSGNKAHVANMPSGEVRVVYTRENARGKEEILNWHKVSDPKYLEQLKSFGIPERNRTSIFPLEAGRPNPLTDRDSETIAQKFEGFNDLSTKLVEKLKGKTKVSKQFIEDMTNMPELKQAERDLIRKQLEDEGDEIDVPTFANKVKTELLPLKTVDSGTNLSKELDDAGGQVYFEPRYEGVSLVDDARGPIDNYFERIYESPIKTSAGKNHFSGSTNNYFAHSRVEDLPLADDLDGYKVARDPDDDEMWALLDENEEPYESINYEGDRVPMQFDSKKEAQKALENLLKGNATRRVIEIQSDLFQRGRLEDETYELKPLQVGEKITLPSKDGDRKMVVIGEVKGELVPMTDEETYAKVLQGKLQIVNGSVIDPNLRNFPVNTSLMSFRNIEDARQAASAERMEEIAKLEPYRNTWHERVIREEIKKAAADGKTKLQFPTGSTALKVEGLAGREGAAIQGEIGEVFEFQGEDWVVVFDDVHNVSAVPEEAVGRSFTLSDARNDRALELADDGGRALYVEMNDSGVFSKYIKGDDELTKAYTFIFKDKNLNEKDSYEAFYKEFSTQIEDLAHRYAQRELATRDDAIEWLNDFSIDGHQFAPKESNDFEIFEYDSSREETVPKGEDGIETDNPIYKFYEKEVGRYLSKKYGAERVEDAQGVEWWEVDLTKSDYKNAPVDAFAGGAAGFQEDEEGNLSFNPLAAAAGVGGMAAAKKFTKKPVSEVDRAIAAGKVRVISKDGRELYQYKKGDKWVTAPTDADAVLRASNFEKGLPVTSPIDALTGQKAQVAKAIQGSAKDIKQIAEETKIKEPNIRRILGVGAKEGTFERVDKGIYRLKINGEDRAYVEVGDAVDVLPRLADEGFKSDMVFLDIPYDTPAVKGGNRGANYNLISVEQFGKVLDAVGKIARTPDSPVIHMYSQAKSGLPAMMAYNDLFIAKGWKPVAKGEYAKTYKDGSPVGFPTKKGFMRTEPEGILVFTKSGNFDGHVNKFNFKLVRPKGYQTEKPAEMLAEMIKMTTKEGDTVLDPFAGSGVTGAEAVKLNRKSYLIERDENVAKEITTKRVESAVPKSTPIAPVVEKKGIRPIAKSEGEVRSIEASAEKSLAKLDPLLQKEARSLESIVDTGVTDVKKKVNLLDYIRTPDRVLKKIGFSKEAGLMREAYDGYVVELPKNIYKITEWSKRAPEKGASERIFKWLDGQPITLSQAEREVAMEIKEWLKEWAKRLKLPEEKQVSNYITRLFEDQLIQKEFDEDLAKIIADKIPSQVYNPFLQKRLGAQGYKQDVWSALDAYAKRGTRKVHLDPVLEKIQAKAGSSLEFSNIEESQWRYLENYIKNVQMRPTQLDNLMDNAIKSMVGYRLGQRPVTNLTKKLRKLTYLGMLGGNVTSALRNISQGINTYAVLGERYTALGYAALLRKGATEELESVGILANNFIQDRSIHATRKLLEKIDKTLFFFFDQAEKINRGAAYFGAKAQYINRNTRTVNGQQVWKQGASMEEAVKYAKGIVRKTQFNYDVIDAPVAMASDIAKTVAQFQTYTTKQTEFLIELRKDKTKMEALAAYMRYGLAGTVFVYTIGQAFDMKMKEILPWPRLGVPPSLKLPWEIGKAAFDAPDKYGQDRTTGEKLKDIGKSGIGLIPAGMQLKKTIEGIQAVTEGGSFDKAGKLQFEVGGSPLKIAQAVVFGKYSSKGARTYFDKLEGKLSEDEKRIQSVYAEVQVLKESGKPEEAVALFESLSPEDQAVYKTYRGRVKAEETAIGKKAILPTFQKIRAQKASGDVQGAIAAYDALSEEQKRYYQLVKKQIERDEKAAKGEKPEFTDGEPETPEGIINTVVLYARATGKDPVQAFRALFTDEKLRYVSGNAVVLERLSLDESQQIKDERGGLGTEMKLDHRIPLQLGGTNDEDNLILIPTALHASYSPVENALGKALRDEKISRRKAKDLITKFKDGEITSQQVMEQIP